MTEDVFLPPYDLVNQLVNPFNLQHRGLVEKQSTPSCPLSKLSGYSTSYESAYPTAQCHGSVTSKSVPHTRSQQYTTWMPRSFPMPFSWPKMGHVTEDMVLLPLTHATPPILPKPTTNRDINVVLTSCASTSGELSTSDVCIILNIIIVVRTLLWKMLYSCKSTHTFDHMIFINCI